MIGFLLQSVDSLAASIPSFSDRFNFTLPLIALLLIVMFLLLLKSYSSEGKASSGEPSGAGKKR